MDRSNYQPVRPSLFFFVCVWRNVPQIVFTPCASLKIDHLEQAVRQNLLTVLEVYRGKNCLFQIQVDEIAQEKRARHYQPNDTVSQSR